MDTVFLMCSKVLSTAGPGLPITSAVVGAHFTRSLLFKSQSLLARKIHAWIFKTATEWGSYASSLDKAKATARPRGGFLYGVERWGDGKYGHDTRRTLLDLNGRKRRKRMGSPDVASLGTGRENGSSRADGEECAPGTCTAYGRVVRARRQVGRAWGVYALPGYLGKSRDVVISFIYGQARMRGGEGSRYGAIAVQVAAAAVPFWPGGAGTKWVLRAGGWEKGERWAHTLNELSSSKLTMSSRRPRPRIEGEGTRARVEVLPGGETLSGCIDLAAPQVLRHSCTCALWWFKLAIFPREFRCCWDLAVLPLSSKLYQIHGL
ncbi:hypothetical protein DFH08DRAFT_1023211 [Mycena albidolilacea]|uniref:Uncharacterized protein n=1 Tax=Mycena albidolilacea TaxID=1033008 RepID=A0AAD6ZN97_9AGAR|nr:hypothetical protein DFH08DRAFT_1023211 [Mycena albidolilacea]